MRIFDIVVIGGGITGTAVARLAARNGYTCALLERGDLASGTSSVSSHMLHGGLRYLEHGRLGLVREALAERAIVSRMAPSLARPQRFLVPLYRGDRVRPWKLRLGLQAYDWLAGPQSFAPHGMVGRKEALAIAPDLEPDGLRGAGLYTDVVVDDAHLVIAVARDAATHGAEIHVYTEFTSARPLGGGAIELLAHGEDGGPRSFAGRVIVNASGPWADQVRHLLSRSLHPGAREPAPLLRPSRGTHLVYPRLTRGHGLLLSARADGRVFFVVPFGAHSLVGTTEVEVSSPPPVSSWIPTLDEVRYLSEELRRALSGRSIGPALAVYSGLRPLLRSDDEVGRASREHRLVQEGEVFTIAGGKYTTFRVMARDVLEGVQRSLGREGRPIRDAAVLLPAPLPAGAGLECRARFAVEHEFARRVEDVVRRRSTLWLEPDRGRLAAPRIAAVMAELLGWSAERTDDEFQRYDNALWEEEALLQRAREDR